MEVPHSKDLASHADLESCAAHREVRREALTEARTGQPSSRESVYFSGADAVGKRGRQHVWARHRKRPDDPAWS